MITETEKARLREIGKMLAGAEVNFDGEEMASDDESRARFEGGTMAVIDGLFAIREEEEWRGMSVPKEIAAELLRVAGVGD